MEKKIYLKVLRGYRPLFLAFVSVYGMPCKVVRVDGADVSGFIYAFCPSVFKPVPPYMRCFRVEETAASIVFVHRAYSRAFLED